MSHEPNQNKSADLLMPLLCSPVSALQYDGVKLEIMNVENTNFYGLGIFTSDGRFDASAEFLLATKWFAQNSSLNLLDNNYPLIFSASTQIFI